MRKTLGEILFYLLIVIFLFVIICQLGLLPIRFMVVASGSMSPTINTGDIAVVKIDNEKIPSIGDIVYFDLAGHPTLHRVTDYTKGKITTKGDANTVIDSETTLSVNGYYLFKIPLVGYPVHYIQQFFYNLVPGR